MPTNIYRNRAGEPSQSPRSRRSQVHGQGNTAQARPRIVTITAGRTTLNAQLAHTPTADRFWAALPIFSVAEIWGDTIHFETPMPTGRDRTARLNARPGDICFWTSDNRVIIAYGPSPISRPGEIRLPQLCNIFASVMGDASVLNIVTPGEKVTITADN